MATYTGKINLVNMSEVAEAGSLYTWIMYADDMQGGNMSNEPAGKKYIGISYNNKTKHPSMNPEDYTWSLFQAVSLARTKMYYAISRNGIVPPVELKNLKIDDNGLLSFEENGQISLIISENLLGAKFDSKQLELGVLNNKIYGVGATWTEEIPQVPPGYYLWSKTVYEYTDNSQETHYSNSYHGENAQAFQLKLNQNEILKFINKNGELSVSPEILNISLIEEISDSEVGYQTLNLDPNKFSCLVFDPESNKKYPIKDPIINFSNGEIRLNLKEFLTYYQIDFEETAAYVFNQKECILCLEYTYEHDNRVYNLSEYLGVRYGLSKDTAQLDLKASEIVASMQDAKLVFGGHGLRIKNGSFEIVDKDDKQLLYSNGGNLTLVGHIKADSGYFKGDITGATGTFSGRLEAESGFFKGEVYADKGSFKGAIEAQEGTIGGFTIQKNKLVSSNSEIILDGRNGQIEAENIVLGKGARIREYIQIGENVKLNNLNSIYDNFLEVTKADSEENLLSIDGQGVIKIGQGSDQFIIDGVKGAIYAGGSSSTDGWSISNGSAKFHNITARGSIKASVLEYGEIQSVGGMVLIRPSSKIQKIETYEEEKEYFSKIWVERIEGFKVGDTCLVNKEAGYEYNSVKVTPNQFYKGQFFILVEGEYVLATDFQETEQYYSRVISISKKCLEIVKIDYTNKVLIIQGEIAQEYVSYPIVTLGNIKEEGARPIGIGINASENDSLLTPESISVFEFEKILDDAPVFNSKIILGKLPNDARFGSVAGSYGLSAENVFLKGSLVTQSEIEGKPVAYSGINTLYNSDHQPTSKKKLGQIEGINCGEILLWAGAKTTQPEDIEESKFFVDRNGNMYAGSGYFEGTIITKSKITASEIETAVLRGAGSEPALVIEDAKYGIQFKSSDREESIFALTSTSLVAKLDTIDLNGFQINKDGSLMVPYIYINQDKNAIAIHPNSINFIEELANANQKINGYISFSGGLKFSPNGDNETLSITSTELTMDTEVQMSQAVKYGKYEKNKEIHFIMEYKPVYVDGNLMGYDLYVE